MAMEFPDPFDYIVSVDASAYVADQTGFSKKVEGLMNPNGTLVMTTVNKFVFNQLENVKEKRGHPGQIRRWVTMGDVKRFFCPTLKS